MKQKLKAFLKSNLPPLYTLVCQFQAFSKGELRYRGSGAYLATDDRQLLENVIIPYFASRDDLSKVLFVGCEWFTKHYEKAFKHKEYWTIDREPFNARYGSNKKHIIDDLENLDKYCDVGYFDLIIANGIVGFGTNTMETAEDAFQQCWRCLRSEGLLCLGWNDVSEFTPFALEKIQSLDQFAPYNFPPLATARYAAQTRLKHVFSFFIKAVTASANLSKP